MFIIPDEIIRTLAERQFTLGANMPNTWGLAGNKLLVAADLLAPHIQEAEDRITKRTFEELQKKETSRYLTDEEQNDMFQAGTISVWAMLVALGIENLLKGIIVSKQLQSRIDGKLPASGHDLLNLAKVANVLLTKTEEKQLRMLTEYSVWRGRYNLPEKSNELYQIEKSNSKRTNATSLGHIKHATKTIGKLREKLINEFISARENRHKG